MESNEEFMDRLVEKIGRIIPAKESIYIDTEGIGLMLGKSTATVRRAYLVHPDFPKPITLPVKSKPNDRGFNLWKKNEVINWVNGFQENERCERKKAGKAA